MAIQQCLTTNCTRAEQSAAQGIQLGQCANGQYLYASPFDISSNRACCLLVGIVTTSSIIASSSVAATTVAAVPTQSSAAMGKAHLGRGETIGAAVALVGAFVGGALVF
jgi:hypothetical protein